MERAENTDLKKPFSPNKNCLDSLLERQISKQRIWWSVMLYFQSCLTFCNPMDCSPPGFSVHWILQARILKWVAIPFSRGSSWLYPGLLQILYCLSHQGNLSGYKTVNKCLFKNYVWKEFLLFFRSVYDIIIRSMKCSMVNLLGTIVYVSMHTCVH